MRVKKDYAAVAAEYISNVLDGTIPACKETKQACQRQLDDLARQGTPQFPYIWDQEKANRVLRFVDLCPHVKGKRFVAQSGFQLQPWQVYVIGTPFGWVHMETGLRRFRRAYTEVAKGNGKSPMMSAILSYLAFADEEPGAEVYTAATSTKQARVVFDVCQAMLRKMPKFIEPRGIEVGAHSINQISSNSFVRPLSSEAKGVEGINPYFICVDELHAHDSRDLYDNLDTANGKREGSMLWAITTAGDNRGGICYEVRTYLKKVLDKVIIDESVWGIIYTIDEEDQNDWIGKPDVWRKANPNWNVCVNPEEIGIKAHAAAQMASKQAGFLTKHLNVWVNAYHSWMDMAKFMKCANPALDEADFLGQQCVLGTDLAAKLDIMSKAKVFWKEIDKKLHYYVFLKNWLPDARIEAGVNPQYDGWKRDGWLESGGVETNDFDLVEDSIREDCAKYQVLEVCFDPWQATPLVNRLQGKIPMTQVDQNVKNLSDPMKELEAAIYDGRFHYADDPVLAWAASNVVCKVDKNDNIFPAKEKAENKIDPVTAVITAFNGVARHARLAAAGNGVTSIGNCAKCGELCIGKIVGEKVQHLCKKCEESHGK